VRRACLFSFVLLFGGLLTGCWEGISRQVLATVLSLHGEVVYLSKGSSNFRPANSQAKLSAGAVLKTSSGARANLVLIPGALAQVSGDSELKINELKLRKDGNETGDAMRERIARITLRIVASSLRVGSPTEIRRPCRSWGSRSVSATSRTEAGSAASRSAAAWTRWRPPQP